MVLTHYPTAPYIEDRVLEELADLPFLYTNDFLLVEDVQAIIRILFPSKCIHTNFESSSYNYKHWFENLSKQFTGKYFKYCSNETAIEAFVREGFAAKTKSFGSVNRYFNIKPTEHRMANIIANYTYDLPYSVKAIIEKHI